MQKEIILISTKEIKSFGFKCDDNFEGIINVKIVQGKRCSMCNDIKSFSDFYKNKHWPDGFRVECKSCTKKVENGRIGMIKKYQKKYSEDNICRVDGKTFNLKTAPDELKPLVKAAISVKRLDRIIKKMEKQNG